MTILASTCVAAIIGHTFLIQSSGLGLVVVKGDTNRPTANVTILAEGEQYRCERDASSGTICRAQVPLSIKALRVEVFETGFVSFSKNFTGVAFKDKAAELSLGTVVLVALPRTGPLSLLADVVAYHLPKVGSDQALRVADIRTSAAYNESVRIFDLTLVNTGQTVILKQFWKRWSYGAGGTVSTQAAHLVKPEEEFLVDLPIDIANPTDSDPQLLPSPLVIPAGTPSEPNVYALRVALYYTLVNGARHPASDWDIRYSLYLEDAAGIRVPLLVDELWKQHPAAVSKKWMP